MYHMSIVEKKAKGVAVAVVEGDSMSSVRPAAERLEYHTTVRDMPTDQRPRERLRDYGPQALANAELLAIILRTGTTQDNVLELAGKLLAKYGGLTGLLRAEFGELCLEHGLGEANPHDYR
jgi:DNA repair protein RadC